MDQPTPPNQRVIWNPLLGERVVHAPGRMNRREGDADCPFCADQQSGRWPRGQETWIRPNDFPPLAPPIGEAYVLLYSQTHDLRFPQMSVEQALGVVTLWQDVYADLSARYPCVMTFENSGVAIGQTQAHPHGQTYGVSFLPPAIERESRSMADYHAEHRRCLGCDILAQELGGARVIFESAHWVAFVPEWARYPYEVHCYARQHLSNIGQTPREGDTARDLSALLPRLIRAYDAIAQGAMPYMLVLHQLPDERFHFHIELLPVARAPNKLKYAASSESGFGLWLNDALPEAKAAELRDALALAR
jgi:UDPglucose--hexose-1-phosphate uridylyltransferase